MPFILHEERLADLESVLEKAKKEQPIMDAESVAYGFWKGVSATLATLGPDLDALQRVVKEDKT